MRKLAYGAWGKPKDPSTNVQLNIDITTLLNSLPPGIQLKHVLIRLFSMVLYEIPELNTVIIRGKLRQRLNNRIFIPTIFRHQRKMDLNGINIDDAYKKSINEIKHEMNEKISNLRSGKDQRTQRVIRLFKRFPMVLCKPIILAIDFIQYTCNLSLETFGLPTDPFGSMTMTFLDKFNIRYANIPIYGFSKSPVTIAVGKTYASGTQKYCR